MIYAASSIVVLLALVVGRRVLNRRRGESRHTRNIREWEAEISRRMRVKPNE
jgi:hypothetical protein